MALKRAFGDPNLTPADFSSFSKQQMDADESVKASTTLQPVPTARSTDPMLLSDVIGADQADKIQTAGTLVFHTVGDTGGIIKPEFQFAVAEAMANDVSSGAAFFYHLGDVVYYCGQEQYYFEQFYDPYRNYNAPIFAIPGNHDGAVYQGETAKSLDAFLLNFCSASPAHNPDSQGVARTTMDQPGVYFTLNAPFIRIIGLYSNVSEGGTQGIIAGSTIGNDQLNFLNAQLAAARKDRDDGQKFALVVATHHPPFTASPAHIPSPDMLKMIDTACSNAGIQPDLWLSGHAHQYERFTRTVNGKQTPYVVAGMGGYYNLTGLKAGQKYPPTKTPASGTDASNNPLRLDVFNNNQFGFLRMTVSETSITGVFVTVDATNGKTGTGDSFTLDLKAGTVSSGQKTVAPARKTAIKKKVAAVSKKTVSKKPAAKKTTVKKAATKKAAAKKKR